MTDPLPLAISMGEPAGIGPDLILRLYAERDDARLPPFVVFGNAGFLARARRSGWGSTSTSLRRRPPSAADSFPDALPVVDIDGLVPDKPGDPSPLSAQAGDRGHRATPWPTTLHGAAAALVTAPIHKAALYSAGFRLSRPYRVPRRALRATAATPHAGDDAGA